MGMSGQVVRTESKWRKNGSVESKVTLIANNSRCEVTVNHLGMIVKFSMKEITTVKPNAFHLNPPISHEAAKAIAIQSTGTVGIVTECKLEQKRWQAQYSVKMASGQLEYKIYIDAMNGNIIKFDSKYKY